MIYYKFLLHEIFVLKNFCRVDVLQKYFNMKSLQHSIFNTIARVGEETYRESNCHGRDFRKEMLYSRLPHSYIKKYGRQWLKSRWCAKTLLIMWLWKGTKRYHGCVGCFCNGEVASYNRVTGLSKYSADLAQGRLKVLCSLLFKATLMEPIGSESPLLGLK